jgi:hypothetical protein
MCIMTLCCNCRTIQKIGTSCTICKCPVTGPVALTGEDFELENRKQQIRNNGEPIGLNLGIRRLAKIEEKQDANKS